MKVAEYLERIGFAGDTRPNLATLTQLQEAHLTRVPFENLFVRAGRGVSMDVGDLYAKVVEDGRGGFCYELNTLFAWLLSELGFAPQMVAAGVYSSEHETYGPLFDHLALVVALDGREYLTDVGFGRFSLHPLPILYGEVVHDPHGTFHMDRDGKLIVVCAGFGNQDLVPQYRFDPRPRKLTEFAGMCRYHQSDPASPFTQRTIVTRARSDGRVTLSETRFIEERGRSRSEWPVGPETFPALLRKHFGMDPVA